MFILSQSLNHLKEAEEYWFLRMKIIYLSLYSSFVHNVQNLIYKKKSYETQITIKKKDLPEKDKTVNKNRLR